MCYFRSTGFVGVLVRGGRGEPRGDKKANFFLVCRPFFFSACSTWESERSRQSTPLAQFENFGSCRCTIADAQIGRAIGMDPAPVSIEQLAGFLFKKEEGERSPCNVRGGCVAHLPHVTVLFCVGGSPIALVRPFAAPLLVALRPFWCPLCLGGFGALESRSVLYTERRTLQLKIPRRLP